MAGKRSCERTSRSLRVDALEQTENTSEASLTLTLNRTISDRPTLRAKLQCRFCLPTLLAFLPVQQPFFSRSFPLPLLHYRCDLRPTQNIELAGHHVVGIPNAEVRTKLHEQIDTLGLTSLEAAERLS